MLSVEDTVSRTGGPGGLTHLGMLYRDLDDLVERALPGVRTVLDEGGDVQVTIDPGGADRFRDALGADAERIRFPTPGEAYATPTPEVVRGLRETLPRDRRTLIVAQYPHASPPSWDSGFAEDAVNLVLGDLPLTVLCACDRAADPTKITMVGRCHPRLLGDDGPATNPSWHPPRASWPAPLDAWGPPAVSMTLAEAADLTALRDRVLAVAADTGLAGPAREGAALAAHEAVLVATSAGMSASDPLPGELRVEVRTAGGTVLTEVRCAIPEARGDRADGWRRTCLARLCDRVWVDDGPGGRAVRVLASADRPAP